MYCRRCGMYNEDNSCFCCNCGEKINDFSTNSNKNYYKSETFTVFPKNKIIIIIALAFFAVSIILIIIFLSGSSREEQGNGINEYAQEENHVGSYEDYEREYKERIEAYKEYYLKQKKDYDYIDYIDGIIMLNDKKQPYMILSYKYEDHNQKQIELIEVIDYSENEIEIIGKESFDNALIWMIFSENPSVAVWSMETQEIEIFCFNNSNVSETFYIGNMAEDEEINHGELYDFLHKYSFDEVYFYNMGAEPIEYIGHAKYKYTTYQDILEEDVEDLEENITKHYECYIYDKKISGKKFMNMLYSISAEESGIDENMIRSDKTLYCIGMGAALFTGTDLAGKYLDEYNIGESPFEQLLDYLTIKPITKQEDLKIVVNSFDAIDLGTD